MVAKCLQQPYNWVYEKWATLPLKPSSLIRRLIQIATKVFFALALILTCPCHLIGRNIQKKPLAPDFRLEPQIFGPNNLPPHVPVNVFVPAIEENKMDNVVPEAGAHHAFAIRPEELIFPSDQEVIKEFQDLINDFPHIIIEEQPDLVSEGRKPENLPKNRYANVVPFNQNRVKFGGGQYCNASWMLKEKDPLIVTQGPFSPEQENNFWPMIWEHASMVIMLTNYFEEGRLKCDRYFLDDRAQYGEFTVSQRPDIEVLLETPDHPEEVRIIKRKLLLEKEGMKKEIIHLHLENWKDHQVASPKALALLLREVIIHSDLHPDQAIAAHCSAGVGRAGTFAAIFLAVRKILKDPTLLRNGLSAVVAPTAREVRAARAGSIQTGHQYRLIYQTVRELLGLNLAN